MRIATTHAYLVRRVDTGESNRVVTLLTEDLGKLSAMARGARSSRKRFGAALAPFVLAEAQLRERPGRGDLYELASYHALNSHAALSRDIGVISHASYVTELTGALCAEGQPEPEIFALLGHMYGLLESQAASAPALRVYELQVLAAAGHHPQLDQCVRCAEASLGDAPGFDAIHGGALCSACVRGEERLARSTIDALSDAQRTPLAEAWELSWPSAVSIEASVTMIDFIQAVIGRPLKTVAFIAKMR